MNHINEKKHFYIDAMDENLYQINSYQKFPFENFGTRVSAVCGKYEAIGFGDFPNLSSWTYVTS